MQQKKVQRRIVFVLEDFEQVTQRLLGMKHTERFVSSKRIRTQEDPFNNKVQENEKEWKVICSVLRAIHP